MFWTLEHVSKQYGVKMMYYSIIQRTAGLVVVDNFGDRPQRELKCQISHPHHIRIMFKQEKNMHNGQ